MARHVLEVVQQAAEACCAGVTLRPRATRGLAPLFRALGDETRLEIVALIAAAGRALCVCDIERRFELSQPTISHHLKILREAGVLTSERRGSWVYYAIDRGPLARLAELALVLHGR